MRMIGPLPQLPSLDIGQPVTVYSNPELLASILIEH